MGMFRTGDADKAGGRDPVGFYSLSLSLFFGLFPLCFEAVNKRVGRNEKGFLKNLFLHFLKP